MCNYDVYIVYEQIRPLEYAAVTSLLYMGIGISCD
jgi:hypothetical protein